MAVRYAFYFDSSCCTGCKTCQVACKDRHGLPVGIRWRRVLGVTGGEWRRSGAPWVSDVYAYYLSVAWNHCERPICVEVCPSGAMTQRDDGIVVLADDQCLGCSSCAWACPYGAPQLDRNAGHITKFSLCADQVDRGLPPTCVGTGPSRALDFGDRRDLETRCGSLAPIYPFPDTGPRARKSVRPVT